MNMQTIKLMTKKQAVVPNWLIKLLIIWSEKSYRRGFQHGLLAAEKWNFLSSKEGYVLRYRKNISKSSGLPNNANGLLTHYSCSLVDRHLNYDRIPLVDVIPNLSNGNYEIISLLD